MIPQVMHLGHQPIHSLNPQLLLSSPVCIRLLANETICRASLEVLAASAEQLPQKWEWSPKEGLKSLFSVCLLFYLILG